MSTTLHRLALALSALFWLQLGALAQAREFEDADLAPIAERAGAYFRARDAAQGLDQARAELAASLDALAKSSGRDLLAQPADLARATWLARDFAGRKLRSGNVVTDTWTAGRFANRALEYAYRLPKTYDPESRSYPLLLTIASEGERPADHLRASWTLPEILDGAILVCPQMPEEGEDWTRVTKDGRPGGLSHVLTALAMAGERFAIDFDRAYVVGYGEGVPAALAAGNHSPQRFAGILGRAGDASNLRPDNFENLPTWFAGGGANARRFQKLAQAAGIYHCMLEPGGGEAELWNWIDANPRRAHPARVSIAIGDPFPTRVNWLRLAPIASDARARAEIDRASNSVRIEGQGFSHATLYLDDALLDLSRPITVHCNGVKHEALLERRLSTALDLLLDGTSDPACVYVAQGIFDMTAEASALSPLEARLTNSDYTQRLEAAGGKTRALWELQLWCAANDRAPEREAVLRRLIQIDPDHEQARAALGHAGSRGKWFTTQAAYDRYLRGQDEAVAKSRGYVKRRSEWMRPDERALASKGLKQDRDTGLWLSGADRKQLAKGWVRQDLAWVRPEDAHRVADGQWLVEGEWLELAEANRRHSRIDSMWHIPSATVRLHSTVDRKTSLAALEQMARAVDDVRRVFGLEPALPVDVALLRDEEQLERFAIGDPDGRRRATTGERLYVIHTAFLAESWFPRVDGELEFRGAGAGYWDALAPNGGLYGVHSARLAAGLAYVDAIDPSPKAVRAALDDGPDAEWSATYSAEKQLPAWLRTGAAVYAERFFRDDSVEEGDEGADPWWARAWSLQNLESRGGLRPLELVFAFELDPDDREDGLKLLIEAGLVCAFVVDGGCAPVGAAHAKLKQALVDGRLQAGHVAALEEALLDHKAELLEFAQS